MADSYEINIKNQVAFDTALSEIAKSIREPRDALTAGAHQLLADAEAAAPKLTGQLAGSHRALAAEGKKIRIVVSAVYAAAIHWGWPAHGIRRQPWLVAVWQRSPAPLARMGDRIQAQIDSSAART